MIKRRRRRRHSRRREARSIRSLLSFAAAYPRQIAFSSFLTFFLCWLILTKSLPLFLAARQPDIALALHPNSSRALIVKAENLRKLLLSSMASESAQPEAAAEQTIARLPKAQDAPPEAAALSVRESLRNQIREAASRAIANDPLNATAFRFLAEVSDPTGGTRALMQEAVLRSRRETTALLWLLNDSYLSKDWNAAIGYADVLLRTSPELDQYVMRYLVAVSHNAEGRALLAGKLAEPPQWRARFLGSFNDLFDKDQSALALIADMRKSPRPAATREIGAYIGHLVWYNATDTAFNLWLKTLAPEKLDSLGFLVNPGFESDPDDIVPFNWFVRLGQNAAAEFVPSPQSIGQRLLHISFGNGRVQFPEVSQVLVLPPGRYRIEGKLRGSIISKRGLRWQLRCVPPFETVFGESELLSGHSDQWRVFTMEAQIPQNKGCKGELLRLFHESRSASEDFITGEVWFGSLRLEAIRTQSQ